MKIFVLLAVALILPSAAYAAARGEEKTYSCTAVSEGISVNLKITVRENSVAHVSYSSINSRNGSDCGIEVGDETQADSSGSIWDRWQDIALVHIKDIQDGPTTDGQVLLIFNVPSGYRLSFNPAAIRTNCALHGYIAPSATIVLGSNKCKLKW